MRKKEKKNRWRKIGRNKRKRVNQGWTKEDATAGLRMKTEQVEISLKKKAGITEKGK